VGSRLVLAEADEDESNDGDEEEEEEEDDIPGGIEEDRLFSVGASSARRNPGSSRPAIFAFN
jgi:hypothetical protein